MLIDDSDGTDDDGESWGDVEGDGYIILKITDVDVDGSVYYVTHDTNLEGEMRSIGKSESTEYTNARKLVDSNYWKSWDEKLYLSPNFYKKQGITESRMKH